LLSSLLRPQRSTLFPYTTLFRSDALAAVLGEPEVRRRRQLHAGALELEHLVAVAADPRRAHHDVAGAQRRDGLLAVREAGSREADRKSTRLNSSHVKISYAVFCL